MYNLSEARERASEDYLKFVIDLEPPADDFRSDVIAGLSRTPKALPPKYLYDERGSELFDAICDAPEYYVPRAEMEILETNAEEIAAFAGSDAAVIELGAGATKKISTLLSAMDHPALVVALDISRDFLIDAAAALARAHPRVRVGAAVADFTQPIPLPDHLFAGSERRLVFFPGSTIGNLEPAAGLELLRTARSLVRPGDGLLIGADLIKDPVILEAAYDDLGGATAAFELNILTRIKNELGADIDIAAFDYLASWNDNAAQIEMTLKATRDTAITIGDRTFTLRRGETIHTENSRKFTVDGFQRWAAKAGFRPRRAWTDAERLFSVQLLEAV